MHSLGFFMACSLVAAPLVFADSPETIRPGAAWGVGGQYRKLYESGKPTRVSGNVLSLDSLSSSSDAEPGVQVRLDVGGGKELRVHLGPRWFVFQHDFNITQGQPMVVEGIAISLEKAPVIVANQVSQGERKLILREATGTPKWEPPPTNDDDFKPITILMHRCAGCHQTENHPGSQFLNSERLTDAETIKTLIRVIENQQMPLEHKNFKNTPSGKQLLAWLKKQQAKFPAKK